MLIPSIDLQGGRIVQLVQGETLALATDDFDGWIARFARFPKVQLIDLDAAKNAGDNSALVASICAHGCPAASAAASGPSSARRTLLDGGARKVIVGSSLFRGGAVDLAFAEALAAAVSPDRLIAAVDASGGQVVDRRLAHAAADHAGGSHPRARAVLRRVPLHQRGRRGADAGPRSRRGARGAGRHDRARSRRQAASRRRMTSTGSTASAWTPSPAWRSTRAG